MKIQEGQKLGVAYSDDISGELTINVGKLSYILVTGGALELTCRYPVTNNMERTKEDLDIIGRSKQDFQLRTSLIQNRIMLMKRMILIQTLKKVYEEQTGEKAELIAIGGGTYARSLNSGVAFGPLFPGRPDIAHQKDEYIYIEDLLKATAIYAQAIYELAQ